MPIILALPNDLEQRMAALDASREDGHCRECVLMDAPTGFLVSYTDVLGWAHLHSANNPRVVARATRQPSTGKPRVP